MQFGNPQALWLLALWPFLALLGVRALRRRDAAAARLGDRALVERLYPASIREWRRRRLGLGLVALALLSGAAARPQYGTIEVAQPGFGANVLIALDVSRSMLAEDAKPNRLEAARAGFAWFLKALAGNRVGVMAFAGDAILNCPMTADTELAGRILEALDTDTIGAQGTDLGRAIEVAIGAFERGANAGGRVVVLITDGEDLEGGALAMARRAKEAGIVIDAIGIGDARGAPIQTERGFVQDNAGAIVSTRLRMDILNELAAATGGIAIDAGTNPGAAIDEVAAHINQLLKGEMEARTRTIHLDRFHWLAAPALLLILWMLLLRPEAQSPADPLGTQ